MSITTKVWDFGSAGDGTNAEYDAAEWQEMTAQFFKSGLVGSEDKGIWLGVGTEFNTTNVGLVLSTDTGAALIAGVHVELSGVPETNTATAASSGNWRADRLVLRLDRVGHTASTLLIENAAENTTTLPAMTQTVSTWDIPLRSILVSDTTVTAITDMRVYVNTKDNRDLEVLDNEAWNLRTENSSVNTVSVGLDVENQVDGTAVAGAGTAIELTLSDDAPSDDVLARVSANYENTKAQSQIELYTRGGSALNLSGVIKGAAAVVTTNGDPRGEGSVDFQVSRDGSDQVAAGDYSFLAGARNAADGSFQFMAGADNSGNGDYTGVLGRGNTVNGEGSMGFGRSLNVSGLNNLVGGQSNSVSGDHNLVTGTSQSVPGTRNLISGGGHTTNSSVNDSAIFGLTNDCSAAFAIMGGHDGTVAANYGLTHGDSNTVSATFGVAMGDSCTVGSFGSHSIAIGDGCTSNAQYAIALGNNTTALGSFGFAQGFNCTADGAHGFAKGNNCDASGDNSVAHGWNAEAEGAESFASGSSVRAEADGSTALGVGAVSRIRGGINFASTPSTYPATGQTQGGLYHIAAYELHNTSTYRTLRPGTGSLTIPTDSCIHYRALVCGITAGATDTFAYELSGFAKNDNGALVLLASTIVTVYESDVSFAPRARVDSATATLIIDVQDSAPSNKTVRWSGTVLVSEAMFA